MLALLFLPGCNALNPLCGSSRPAPVIGALSATTVTFAQIQQGFVLTVTGKDFVSSSVVIINGTTLSTIVQSNQQLQVTIPTDLFTGPGLRERDRQHPQRQHRLCRLQQRWNQQRADPRHHLDSQTGMLTAHMTIALRPGLRFAVIDIAV